MKKSLDYAISVDLGTNSVGWAVTDMQNNLLKHKGRNMWGVRLFEEGKTAVERRTFRSTRRRLNRRKERIRLLQDLLSDDVLKVDPLFFRRLNESFLINNERKHFYNFFSDGNFTDVDYYKKFPTIYHLRSYLIHSKEQIDSRLIYLALHHIIKYRGNFLYEGQKFTANNNDTLNNLEFILDYLTNDLEYNIDYNDADIRKLYELIIDNDIRKKDKVKAATEIKTDSDGRRALTNVFNAVLGYKFNLAQLCRLDSVSDELKLSLSDEYNEEMLLMVLDNHYELFLHLKSIYSSMILREILGDKQYLSDSMVMKYNDFKKDLTILKRIIKTYFPNKYKEVFRSVDSKLKNYYNYINSPGECSYDDFYKYLKSIFATKKTELENNDDYNYCLRKIENEEFLLKQKTKMNSIIPYQIHEQELIKILENQKNTIPI